MLGRKKKKEKKPIDVPVTPEVVEEVVDQERADYETLYALMKKYKVTRLSDVENKLAN